MSRGAWLKVSRAALAAAVGLYGPTAVAQVLDIENGEYTTAERSSDYRVHGVLDLDRPAPRTTSAPVNATSSTELRRGLPQIEAMVVDVALEYARHPGIRAAGLSITEWVALFRANIATESNFQQSAISRVGAVGLGQLMPETALRLGVDPYDARDNLRGSARYLLMQLQHFKSKELALAAYNAGPEAVTEYGGIPPFRETQGHVEKVLAIYQQTLGLETT